MRFEDGVGQAHILVCTVHYTAGRDEKKFFRKFFKFAVRAVSAPQSARDRCVELTTPGVAHGNRSPTRSRSRPRCTASVGTRQVHPSRRYLPTQPDALSSTGVCRCRNVLLEAQVQNATPRVMFLETVRFEAPPFFAATDVTGAPPPGKGPFLAHPLCAVRLLRTCAVARLQNDGGSRRSSSRPRTAGSTCSSSSRCQQTAPKVHSRPRRRRCVHSASQLTRFFNPGLRSHSTARTSTNIGKLDIVWKTTMGERGRLQTSQLSRKVGRRENRTGRTVHSRLPWARCSLRYSLPGRTVVSQVPVLEPVEISLKHTPSPVLLEVRGPGISTQDCCRVELTRKSLGVAGILTGPVRGDVGDCQRWGAAGQVQPVLDQEQAVGRLPGRPDRRARPRARAPRLHHAPDHGMGRESRKGRR